MSIPIVTFDSGIRQSPCSEHHRMRGHWVTGWPGYCDSNDTIGYTSDSIYKRITNQPDMATEL